MQLRKTKPVIIVLSVFLIVTTILCVFQLKLIIAEKWNSYALKTQNIASALIYETKALKHNPNNPIYYANMGSFYTKADSLEFSFLFKNKLEVNVQNIDSAIIYFCKAIELTDRDWLFNLNLSLLLSAKGLYFEAEHIMKTCVQRGYVEYPLFAVLGVISERNGDIVAAMEWYVKTIISYPAVIDSKFFIELSARNTTLANNSVIEAERQLEIEYNKTKDPLLAAKLGKLKMFFRNYYSAELLLNVALTQLPTLDRPWYYLGCIAEEKNDTVKALECFNMAVVLDPTDILPLKKISQYDKKYESRLIWMQQYKLSELSFNISKRYGAEYTSEPFVILGFENYLKP